jgi:hypothetical protein
MYTYYRIQNFFFLDTVLLEKEKLQNEYQKLLTSWEQRSLKEEIHSALERELDELKKQNDLQLNNNKNLVSYISELENNLKQKELNLGELERELCRVKNHLETTESELLKLRQFLQERTNSYEDLFERFLLTKKSMEDAVERTVDIDRDYITLKKLYQDILAKQQHTETRYALESERNEKMSQDILKHKKQIELLDNALIKSHEDFNIFKLENNNLKNSLEKSEKNCESLDKKSQSLENYIEEIKCLLKKSEIRVESLETELNKNLQLLRDMEIKLQEARELVNIRGEDANEAPHSHDSLQEESYNDSKTPCLSVVLLRTLSRHIVTRCEKLSSSTKWGRSHGFFIHVLPLTIFTKTPCVNIMLNIPSDNKMVEWGNNKTSIVLRNKTHLLKPYNFLNNVILKKTRSSMTNCSRSTYFNSSSPSINNMILNDKNPIMIVQNFASKNSNDYISKAGTSRISCYTRVENKPELSCMNMTVLKNDSNLGVDAKCKKNTLNFSDFPETRNYIVNKKFWIQVNASESGTYPNTLKNIAESQNNYQNVYDQVEEHIDVVTDQLKKIEKKLIQILVFRSQISKRTHASLSWYNKTHNKKSDILTEYLKNEENFAELLCIEYGMTFENVDDSSVAGKPYFTTQNILNDTFASKSIEEIFRTLFRIQQHIELFTNGCSSFLLGVDLLNDYFEEYLKSKSRVSSKAKVSGIAVNESQRESNISFTSHVSDKENYFLLYPINGSFNSSTEAEGYSYSLDDVRQSCHILPQNSSDLSYTCSKMSSNQSHPVKNELIGHPDTLTSAVTMLSSEVLTNLYENVYTQDAEYDKSELFSTFPFKDPSDFATDVEKNQHKDLEKRETVPLGMFNSNRFDSKCHENNVFNEGKFHNRYLSIRNPFFKICEPNCYRTIDRKRIRLSNDYDLMTCTTDSQILPSKNFDVGDEKVLFSSPQDIFKETLLSERFTEKSNIQLTQLKNDQKFTVTQKSITFLPTTQQTLTHQDINSPYCLRKCAEQLEDYLSKVLPRLNLKSLAMDVYESNFCYINIILKLYFLYQYDKKKVLHLIESISPSTVMSQEFFTHVTGFFTQQQNHQLSLECQLNSFKKENQVLMKKNESLQRDYNILTSTVKATTKEIQLAAESVQKRLNNIEIRDNTASILLKKLQKSFFVLYECVTHKSLTETEKNGNFITFSEWIEKLESWTYEIIQEIKKLYMKRTQRDSVPHLLNKLCKTECIYMNKAAKEAFLGKARDASKIFFLNQTPSKCLSITKQRHKALIIAPSYQDIFISYSYLFLDVCNSSNAKPFNFLKGPFNDAMRWRNVLRSNGWRDDQMKFLCEKRKYNVFNSVTDSHTLDSCIPTKEAILSGLHWLTSTVQPGYQIILILCGCGALIPNTTNSPLNVIPLKEFLASKETLYDPCFLPSNAFSFVNETGTKVTKCEATDSNYSHIVCCGHTQGETTLKSPSILSVSGIPTQSILSYFNKVPAQADVTLLWDFEITGSSFHSSQPTYVRNSNIKLNFLSKNPSKLSTTICVPRYMDIRDILERALRLFPNMKILLDTKSPFSIDTMTFEKRVNLCYESLKPLACNLYFLAASNGQTLAYETNINGVFHGRESFKFLVKLLFSYRCLFLGFVPTFKGNKFLLNVQGYC